MDIKTLSELRNKKNKLLSKVVRITNKKNSKDGLTFNDINALYNELLNKYKPEDIQIIGRTFDNRYATLKSKYYVGDDLKYDDENYFEGKAKEIKDKLTGSYYSIDIEIKL